MQSGKRLLVVDDTPSMGEFVRLVAIELGYDVQVEIHGADFMSVFDHFDPDVVVIDIVMPDIDGVELVRWLRDRGSQPRIIVASALEPESAQLSAVLGMVGGLEIVAIRKPFDPDELIAAVTGNIEQGAEDEIQQAS